MPHNTERPETEYLYHYQRFDRKEDRRWLINTLTRAQIYCSNPLHFNDPWDGKPHIRSDDFRQPERAEQVARYFERVATPPMKGKPVPRNPDLLKKLIELANPELEAAIGRMYRVYCLSPFPDINLMWSHYARGHTGICLEFSRKNRLFAAAQQIIYDERLPGFDIDRGEDQAHLMLTTKSDEWAYEREYRLIAKAGEAPENDGASLFVTRNNHLDIEREWLISVIAGCKCPVDDLKDLVSKHSEQVPVKRAVRKGDSYRVVIEST